VKTIQAALLLTSAALALTLTLNTTGTAGTAATVAGAPPKIVPRGAPAVRTLDSADRTSRPDVVVAGNGTVTVVWSREDQVVARSRVDGSWRPRVVLGHGHSPRVGVDASGSLTVIWLRHLRGFGPQVMVARRPVSTGAWTEPRAVSAPAPAVSSARGAYSPSIAVADVGATVVSWLWNQEDSGAARVQARFRPARGPWEPIATLSARDARNPVSASDGSGQATVAYASARARPRAVTRTQDGWGEPVRLGRHGVNAPQVAAGAGAEVVVTFAASIDQAYRPQAVVRGPDGTWSDPVSLEAPAALTVLDPVVDVDAAGAATAAWWRSDHSIAVATHERGATWSGPEVVVPPGRRILARQPYLDLAVSPSGTALLTWTHRVAGESWVSAALRVAGTWTTSRVVSATDQGCAAGEPDARAGTAVLAWRCRTDVGDLVQVAESRQSPPGGSASSDLSASQSGSTWSVSARSRSNSSAARRSR
jgi:hypothetical protein